MSAEALKKKFKMCVKAILELLFPFFLIFTAAFVTRSTDT